MTVSWEYSVQYSTDDLNKKNKIFKDAQLLYSPVERKVILQSNNQEIVNAIGIPASGLFPGGEFTIEGVFIRVLDRVDSSNSSNRKNFEKFEILFTKDKTKKSKKWEDGHVTLENNLAIFYNSDGRVIHRKILDQPLFDGYSFETSTYLIEVTFPSGKEGVPCNKIDPVKRTDNFKNDPEIFRYELLYTKDKIKKLKRWLDGFLCWNPITLEGDFRSDTNATIYRRKLTEADLSEGNDINSASFIFRIGDKIGPQTRPIDQQSIEIDNDPVQPNKPKVARIDQGKTLKRVARSSRELVEMLQKKSKNDQ